MVTLYIHCGVESCDGSWNGSEGCPDDDEEEEREVVVEWKPCSHALGQWERHTTVRSLCQ